MCWLHVDTSSIRVNSAHSVDTSTAPTTPVPTTVFDVDDPRPLLTMASWPYLEEGPSRPRDLPFFVVYPNGQAIVLITRRPFDPQTDWESQRTTWDGPALDAIEWEGLRDIECAVISDFD